MSIYGKPVWQLLIDFAEEHLDLEGGTFTPQDATRWFQQKYPNIKKGTINAHIRMMSTNVKVVFTGLQATVIMCFTL